MPLLPITLNAGSQLNVTLQFTPPAAGTQTGALQIGFGSGSYTAALTGNGVASFLGYQVTEDGRTTAIAPGMAIALDNTSVGAKSTAVLQFQNVGTTAILLSTIGVSGTGFSITDGPFLPITLQPQQSNTIAITYAPSQPGASSGRLIVGSDNFLLSAKGLGPLLQFSYQAGSATAAANPGDVISFPPLPAGQTESIQFTLSNGGTTAAPVVSAGVLDSKGVFQLASGPAFPLQLAPGGTVNLGLSFTPQAAGEATATLLINNLAFTLAGLTTAGTAAPALPGYQFTGASGVQQPFQQPAIGLSLNAAYTLALSGTLTLNDSPAGFFGDPAVQFSTGSRQVAFTIPANTLQAVFPGGSTQIRLQTGTVAGTLTITPDFVVTTTGTDVTPTNAATLQMTIGSLSPVLLTASAGAITTTGFSIAVSGYTTTRSLNYLTFQFTPASGATLSATSVTVDLTGASSLWFQSTASQALGGEFTITVPFTLGTGSSTTAAGTDLTKSISSIAVTGTSSAGTSNSLQVVLP